MKVKKITSAIGRLEVRDPYIIAMNHYDKYPEGNGNMEPKTYLPTWEKGSDFNNSAPWRMYHGDKVPGFPQHPHYGFEIATIVPEGYADHFDSKGTKGRYGNGDVQLMSAGSGVMHSEMFPLVHDDKPNHLRLFQVWMNLPAKSKDTDPDYRMLWREDIPVASIKSAEGNKVNIKVILGEYYGVKAIGALKNSWAADSNNHVGIALIDMEPNTEFKLENVSSTLNRFLLMYEGAKAVDIDGTELNIEQLADLVGDQEIIIKTGDTPAKLLLLEGEPMNEPVFSYGPFVASSKQKLIDKFEEFGKTEFGGWPWGEKESDIILDKDAGRFASYNFDKTIDKPKQ